MNFKKKDYCFFIIFILSITRCPQNNEQFQYNIEKDQWDKIKEKSDDSRSYEIDSDSSDFKDDDQRDEIVTKNRSMIIKMNNQKIGLRLSLTTTGLIIEVQSGRISEKLLKVFYSTIKQFLLNNGNIKPSQFIIKENKSKKQEEILKIKNTDEIKNQKHDTMDPKQEEEMEYDEFQSSEDSEFSSEDCGYFDKDGNLKKYDNSRRYLNFVLKNKNKKIKNSKKEYDIELLKAISKNFKYKISEAKVFLDKYKEIVGKYDKKIKNRSENY